MKKRNSKRTAHSVRSSVKQRGRAPNNIWSVWSPKTQRRWLLDGDLREEHWLWLEADPAVVSFVLGPGLGASELSLDTELAEVDAVVRLESGTVEWRCVRYHSQLRDSDLPSTPPADGSRPSFSRRLVTDELLSQQSLLIGNFRRIVAAQARTADFPPVSESEAVEARLRAEGRIVLGDLVEGLDSHRSAIMFSGAFALLSRRFAISDLDVARLSMHTQLWRRQ